MSDDAYEALLRYLNSGYFLRKQTLLSQDYKDLCTLIGLKFTNDMWHWCTSQKIETNGAEIAIERRTKEMLNELLKQASAEVILARIALVRDLYEE